MAAKGEAHGASVTRWKIWVTLDLVGTTTNNQHPTNQQQQQQQSPGLLYVPLRYCFYRFVNHHMIHQDLERDLHYPTNAWWFNTYLNMIFKINMEVNHVTHDLFSFVFISSPRILLWSSSRQNTCEAPSKEFWRNRLCQPACFLHVPPAVVGVLLLHFSGFNFQNVSD